jgi:hypothetical protein
LLFAGIGVGVLGIVAAVVLLALSASAQEKTVQRFARAPVGCTTTLEFEKQATFIIYVETRGSLGSVAGDCSAGGISYDRGDDDLPRVSLTLLDGNDQETPMSATDTPSYSVDAFAGQAVQRVQIDSAGTYRLTVTSDDTDFAIAVGGEPDADANAMTLAGIGAAIAGVLLGGVLILLGLRKQGGPSNPASPTTSWQPTPAPVPGWQPHATVPVAAPTYQPQPAVVQPPIPAPGPGWGAPPH